MANSDGWPPPPNTDNEAFERVTEGQKTILGTGGPPPKEAPPQTARTEDH